MAVDSAAMAPGARLARGVCRAFAAHGATPVCEVTLRDGRRADVLALDDRGRVTIVEVKASRADFRADAKWDAYRAFCDRFYFAVPADFPQDILPGPDVCGVLVADAYDAVEVRAAPHHPISGQRRRALVLRVARTAGNRLWRLTEPAL